MKQTQEIRDVYADPELLEAARNNNWTGQDYDDAVQKKLAEKWAKQSGRNVSVDDEVFNPMYVNPEVSCEIKVNWDKNEYKRRGWSEVSYDADYTHEKVHEQNCKQAGNPLKYSADMSFPQKLSQEELSAYDAKLKFLQNWMQKNCH